MGREMHLLAIAVGAAALALVEAITWFLLIALLWTHRPARPVVAPPAPVRAERPQTPTPAEVEARRAILAVQAIADAQRIK